MRGLGSDHETELSSPLAVINYLARIVQEVFGMSPAAVFVSMFFFSMFTTPARFRTRAPLTRTLLAELRG